MFKHIYEIDVKKSVIVKEYLSHRGEPLYQIPMKENLNLYKKYAVINDSSKIHFLEG